MDKKHGAGIGIGYVSIMIIFAVICLTIFAVLSFQSAYSNSALTEKSAEYISEYYAADEKTAAALATLDDAALKAAGEIDFGGAFLEYAGNVDGTSFTNVPEGIRADITAEINERQKIVVSAVFYSNPRDGKRFEIIGRATDIIDAETNDKPLGVWDGQF